MGRAYILAEDAEASLQHLDSYLDSCVTTKDVKGQGQACSALAAAYQSLGDAEKAVKFLQKFLDIAKKTDNLSAQAEACCNLGVIHNRRGEFDKAVHFFQKNFEYSRSIVSSGNGNRRIVDNARVNLGMARGNAQIGSYMNVISYDLSSLLLWKNRRLDFSR